MACGSSPPGTGTGPAGNATLETTPVAVPAQASDVDATYEKIGNACNGGTVTRGLRTVSALEPQSPWSTPDADPAGLGAMKRRDGKWDGLLVLAELDLSAFSEKMETRSPEQADRCGAAREIVSPAGDGKVSRFFHVMLYAGEHARPATVPARGLPETAATAPVRLLGYLDLGAGERQEMAGGGVVYRDMKHQHVPIQVGCDKPLAVSYGFVARTDDEVQALDPALCRPRGDGSECLLERVTLPTDARCTLVAVDAKYRSTDGEAHALSLGAHLEPQASTPGAYKLTLDRFAFHAQR